MRYRESESIFRVAAVVSEECICQGLAFIFLVGFCIRTIFSPFPTNVYEHIPSSKIESELVSVNLKEDYSPELVHCPRLVFVENNDVFGQITEQYWSWDENVFDLKHNNFARSFDIRDGGSWEPNSCTAVHNVTLVVPYRNRREQLKIFLFYIHQFLQLQFIDYKILVVEQTDSQPFNRGKLFNVGFVEALKQNVESRCFIFHDMDLLPEHLSNIYACSNHPRHMSASVNTFRYQLLYKELFGGAISILDKQFKKANGFSNEFFGWGGEDDEFYQRLKFNSMHIVRFPSVISSYRMLPHKKEPVNLNRFQLLRQIHTISDQNGLNDLNYTISNYTLFPLYTLLQVNL